MSPRPGSCETEALGALRFLDDGMRAHATGLVRCGRAVSLFPAPRSDDAPEAAGACWSGVSGRAAGRLVGRGVLLDVARATAGGGSALAVDERRLRATVEAQGPTSTVRRGDIALVRSGGGPGAAARLSRTAREWLRQSEIAAVATDARGFALPPDPRLPLGSLFRLDELAADCAADHVYEFLLFAAPLPVHGAPVHPVAIK